MDHYHRIQNSLEFLAGHFREQPSLEQLACQAGLSEFHFQRVFTEWAGVSPKKFLQHLTVQHARRCLDESASVLEAALDAGLSGPSRLHDLFVMSEALSPGEYKRGGDGLLIDYGVHDSRFGPVLLQVSPRGVTGLSFMDHQQADGSLHAALASMRQRLPNASYRENPETTRVVADQLFTSDPSNGTGLRLLLCGTPFQLQVWRALLAVPEGACVSYGKLAEAIGKPAAARAVGRAVGANPIAWLIPCHRVIRQSGETGGYRWGSGRKLALLGTERCRSVASSS